jgi:protein-disulfide isomerase
MSGTRRDRREAELAERREKRQRQRQRQRQSARGQLPLLPITLGVLALAVVGVLIYAFVIAPPPPPVADVRSPTQPAPYELADGSALGALDAPLTIEIWSDYQCPACAQLARSVNPLLIADYVEPGKVRLAYREFAFLGPESIEAAAGVRCAERQGRFWQFHDYLFANAGAENQGGYSAGRLELMARNSGLDVDQWSSCMADPQVRSEVAAEREEGVRLGVNSTPTLIVGDEMLRGVPQSYPDLAALIDAQLEALGE